MDEEILQKEIDWLMENAKDFPRLKRKVVLEYLGHRIQLLKIKKEALENAEKVIQDAPEEKKTTVSRKTSSKKTKKASKDEHESSL